MKKPTKIIRLKNKFKPGNNIISLVLFAAALILTALSGPMYLSPVIIYFIYYYIVIILAGKRIIANNYIQKKYNFILGIFVFFVYLGEIKHLIVLFREFNFYNLIFSFMEIIIIMSLITITYMNYREYKFYKSIEKNQE